MQTNKLLSIKANALHRLVNDVKAYEKEKKTLIAKLEKLLNSKADSHEVKKHREFVEENEATLCNVLKCARAALFEIQQVMKKHENDTNIQETKEWTDATTIIADAKLILEPAASTQVLPLASSSSSSSNSSSSSAAISTTSTGSATTTCSSSSTTTVCVSSSYSSCSTMTSLSTVASSSALVSSSSSVTIGSSSSSSSTIVTTKNKTPCVCVFGSSRAVSGDFEWKIAEELGTKLAKLGYHIMTGGYCGTMEAISLGASRIKPAVDIEGVISPSVFIERGDHGCPYLNVTTRTTSISSRLCTFADHGDVFIALPGSLGTVGEILFIWNINYCNQYANKPASPLFLARHPWKKLVDFLVEQKMVFEKDAKLVRYFDTVDELLKMVQQLLPAPNS
eukprot:TRINITY_DN11698_c0_g1_i1.p2 TRINITY_DN11698_c0_g1~~TRINITY_DN11698_c0_g1_i1.p2  ORF type:complete len:394 (+),score=126.10 TRINITY_DN11698_c0_g1_i1:67-1248(+)